MTVETLVAEVTALTAGDVAPDERDLAVRHELPVETVRTTMTNALYGATFGTMAALYWCTAERRLVGPGGQESALDRSARSLALLLARVVERVRCDPPVNFEDGAVRAAVAVLRGRLDECVPVADDAIDDRHDQAPFPCPSAHPRPALVDGAAALVACPDARQGRDRPSGATATSPPSPQDGALVPGPSATSVDDSCGQAVSASSVAEPEGR